MSQGRGHIFDDPRKLNEMLALRKLGMSTTKLGERYGVDHTTIVYHSKRYGVTTSRAGIRQVVVVADIGKIEVRRPKVVVSNAVARVVTDFDGTVLNKGKTYAEYVAEARRREQIRKFGKELLPESKQEA